MRGRQEPGASSGFHICWGWAQLAVPRRTGAGGSDPASEEKVRQSSSSGRSSLPRGERGPLFVPSLSRSRGDKGPPAPWDLPCPAQSGLRLLLLIPRIQHLLNVHVSAARFLTVSGLVFFHPCLLSLLPGRHPRAAGSLRPPSVALCSRRDLLQMLGGAWPARPANAEAVGNETGIRWTSS